MLVKRKEYHHSAYVELVAEPEVQGKTKQTIQRCWGFSVCYWTYCLMFKSELIVQCRLQD